MLLPGSRTDNGKQMGAMGGQVLVTGRGVTEGEIIVVLITHQITRLPLRMGEERDECNFFQRDFYLRFPNCLSQTNVITQQSDQGMNNSD